MNKRHVLYLSEEQEAIMSDLAGMLGLDTPTAAAKHCMMLGLTAMRTQLASWSQSRAIDQLVKATDRMADASEDTVSLVDKASKKRRSRGRRHPGPSSTGMQSQK